MPEFLNPFSGKVPDRKITTDELIRAIRLDLAAEHEAVHLYTAHAEATDNRLAKKVLLDIADEERVHAGEFSRLLAILTGDEDSLLSQGGQEVDAMVAELSAESEAGDSKSKANIVSGNDSKSVDDDKSVDMTIGSLKK